MQNVRLEEMMVELWHNSEASSNASEQSRSRAKQFVENTEEKKREIQKRNENENKRSALTNVENTDERMLENSKDVMHEVAKSHGLRIDENMKKKSKRNA